MEMHFKRHSKNCIDIYIPEIYHSTTIFEWIGAFCYMKMHYMASNLTDKEYCTLKAIMDFIREME